MVHRPLFNLNLRPSVSCALLQVALAFMLWAMLDDILVLRDLACRAFACSRMPSTPLHIETAELVAQHTGAAVWSPPALAADSSSSSDAPAEAGSPTVGPTGPSPADAVAAAAALQQWRAGVPRSSAAAAAAARATAAKARIEAVLLLLNVVAFVGYATIPLTYFVPESSSSSSSSSGSGATGEVSLLAAALRWPQWWPGHDAVAWWGNFAGDVAWSVEPALMLATPLLLGKLTQQQQQRSSKKVKAA
jgi:hypothetical protein